MGTLIVTLFHILCLIITAKVWFEIGKIRESIRILKSMNKYLDVIKSQQGIYHPLLINGKIEAMMEVSKILR